jgi:hypothetical protein
MKPALNKGDIVWVDTSAFIASPQRTGTARMCEVLGDAPESADQVYVVPCPPNPGSPMYVFKSALREPDAFKGKR